MNEDKWIALKTPISDIYFYKQMPFDFSYELKIYHTINKPVEVWATWIKEVSEEIRVYELTDFYNAHASDPNQLELTQGEAIRLIVADLQNMIDKLQGKE